MPLTRREAARFEVDRSDCASLLEVLCMPTRTEEVAAKVMGAATAVKASLMGLHGVFRVLVEEHAQLIALLTHVENSSEADTRRRLFPQIQSQLLAHEESELRATYPVFLAHLELVQFAHVHDADVDRLEEMLFRLAATDYDNDAWESIFDRFFELVRDHITEEENASFPAAERVLGRQEAERLEGPYLAARAGAASERR
jgi:hemerythrin superfamily protein